MHSCSRIFAFLIISAISTKAFSQEATSKDEKRVPTQSSIEIKLANERITDEGNGISQVFQLPADGKIHSNGKAFDMIKPKLAADEELAYLRIYFVGKSGKIEKGIMVLVAGYKTSEATYYVDLNNNLDFTDDGPPTTQKTDEKVVLELKGDETNSRFAIELIPFNSIESMTPETMSQYQNLFKGFEEYMGGKFADGKYWYLNRRLNTRTCSVEIDGKRTMLGLQDYDCDGLYNGERDRLMVGEFAAKTISDALADGAVNLVEDAIFLIEHSPYKIVEVKPDGSSIKIVRSTEMPDRLFVGSSIPGLKLKSFDGKETSLDELIEPNKLLVIDFWGHWCGPCIGAIPKTIEFNKRWNDKVVFVGIHMGDHDEARKLVETNNIPFPQFECSDELEETFFIDSWPTYVVIDSTGKLISFRSSLKEIEKTFVE